jgi:hypothetical protein
MYRESHEGLLRTIVRLERELEGLTSVRRGARERGLWFLTAVSLLCAVTGVSAAAASREHAQNVEQTLRRTRARLDVKTSDLDQCLALARRAAAPPESSSDPPADLERVACTAP